MKLTRTFLIPTFALALLATSHGAQSQTGGGTGAAGVRPASGGSGGSSGVDL